MSFRAGIRPASSFLEIAAEKQRPQCVVRVSLGRVASTGVPCCLPLCKVRGNELYILAINRTIRKPKEAYPPADLSEANRSCHRYPSSKNFQSSVASYFPVTKATSRDRKDTNVMYAAFLS